MYSVALSQAPAKAESPRTRGSCIAWSACLAPSFRRYQFILLGDRGDRVWKTCLTARRICVAHYMLSCGVFLSVCPSVARVYWVESTKFAIKQLTVDCSRYFGLRRPNMKQSLVDLCHWSFHYPSWRAVLTKIYPEFEFFKIQDGGRKPGHSQDQIPIGGVQAFKSTNTLHLCGLQMQM